MPRLFVRGLKAGAFLALMLAAVLAPDGGTPRLWLYDENRQLVLSAGTEAFSIGFTHSINLSPVDEEFSIAADGTLVLERELFNQFGTGMPSGEEDGVHMEGGRYVTRPGRKFSELALRVSPVPGHVLRLGGREYELTRWAPVSGLLFLRATALIGIGRTHRN